MDDAWAAVLAALIAALAATVGLIITKESKTSEFRQTWINELRNALTKLGSVAAVSNIIKVSGGTHEVSNFEEIMRLEGEVKMRINLQKPSTLEKELLSSIRNIKGSLSDDVETFQDKLEKYHLTCARVLKKEWVRVKAGEIRYRLCLYICSLICFLFLAISAIYFIFNYQELWGFIKKSH